jgi:signal transduction histidine kinase
MTTPLAQLRKILVVEDTPVNAHMLLAMLRKTNVLFPVETVVAESLAAARQRLAAETFDIALLDLNLPDSKGLATLTAFQATGTGMPVVIITAEDDLEVAVRAISQGAQDFLVKGHFGADLLAKTIHCSIERSAYEEQVETERKHQLTILQKQTQVLAEERNRAETYARQLVQTEMLRALGELTGGLAHELNQPLNIMKIICQSVLRDVEKGQFQEEDAATELPELIAQLDRMAGIIEQMRCFTQAAHEKQVEEVSIGRLLENILRIFRPQLHAEQIELSEEIAPELSDITADPQRLEQALVNLLTNAMEAVNRCAHASKRITLRARAADLAGSAVIIEIEDNGDGIAEAVRHKVFQPFFTNNQALPPDGQPSAGRGLGLSIAHAIICDHQGTIELDSTVGEGSTFRITLPMARMNDSI